MSIFSANNSTVESAYGKYKVGPHVDAEGSLIAGFKWSPSKRISGLFSKPRGGIVSLPVTKLRILPMVMTTIGEVGSSLGTIRPSPMYECTYSKLYYIIHDINYVIKPKPIMVDK